MMTNVLRSKVSALFASVLLLLVLAPFLEGVSDGSKILDVLYTLILLTAVYAVSHGRTTFVLTAVLAGVTIMLLWTGTAVPPDGKRIAGGVSYILLNTVVIAACLKRVVTAKRVDEDVLIGAITIYLLLGVAFAFWFAMIHAVNPQAFDLPQVTEDGGWTQFLYLSFATLTTLGYGDITPLTPVARIVSSLLAVIGVLYQAILIARLVSLYRGPPDPS